MTDHDPLDLDTLLSESAPLTSQDGPVRAAALEAMARDARPSRGRRVRRPLLAGAGALALVFAGGMAASAAFDWHVPWANDAVAEVTYTLPSGELCPAIIGNLKGSPRAVEAAEELLGDPGFIATIDLDAAFAKYKQAAAEGETYFEGELVDGGPGTQYWDEDREWVESSGAAIVSAVEMHLDELGLAGELESFDSEYLCGDDQAVSGD